MMFNAGILASASESKALVLADFENNQRSLSWRTVNDGVMGGISRGSYSIGDKQTLFFKGDISLENNGGFSSIRTYGKRHDLSDYNGFEIKVKGDGRKYYLTSRANNRNMLAFWHPVQTVKDQWVTVRVPFNKFYATSFGKRIPGLRLQPKNITSVGFMLYDKKSGTFSLEVDHISAYKNG
ncbi:CIA30 family protein [Verrucomicrobiaceae bacterium N1E253]|uniref:CIA30 family protein n=2 Tax=Oceaniferula marina TaxID=2748318 RepID=A0A851GIE9_9BACT|nr:CIA30 family protein [Oceaniferula marina]